MNHALTVPNSSSQFRKVSPRALVRAESNELLRYHTYREDRFATVDAIAISAASSLGSTLEVAR